MLLSQRNQSDAMNHKEGIAEYIKVKFHEVNKHDIVFLGIPALLFRVSVTPEHRLLTLSIDFRRLHVSFVCFASGIATTGSKTLAFHKRIISL